MKTTLKLETPEQLAQYNDYFDDCEKANKIPLSFDEWRNKQEQS